MDTIATNYNPEANELITTLVVIDKLDNTNNGVDMTLDVEWIQ